jgi:hypothetical protein
LPCVKTTGGRLYVLTMYVDSLCCATQAPACARARVRAARVVAWCTQLQQRL